jgi:geranylgeranyl diphosphate synthase type II
MDTVAARKARVAALKAQVETRLLALVPPRRDGLPGALHHALATPGKRLRPLLVLLVATQLGADVEDALDAACAVELVHAASLVLDDLPCMDDATLRRGEPCVHLRFGEDIAVLAGVALLNQAFGLVVRAAHLSPALRLEMVADLTAAVGLDGLVSGQEMDLHDRNTGLRELREAHHRKTGVLFMAAAAIGGRLGGASASELAALDQFAADLGLAFQARDDVSDAMEAEPVSGGAAMRKTLISHLGAGGATAEAERRLLGARSALRAGGGRLDPLAGYLDLLLGAPERITEAAS